MPKRQLTDQQIRDRKFLNGGLSRVKSQVSSQIATGLDQIKSYIDPRDTILSLVNKVFKVEVVNMPEFQQAVKTVTEAPAMQIDVTREGTDQMISALKEVKDQVAKIDIPEAKDVDLKPVVNSVGKLEKAIKAIKIPEYKSEKIQFPSRMSMAEAKDIIKELKSLDKTIKALPKNMEAADRSESLEIDNQPILDALASLEKSIKSMPAPGKIEFPERLPVHIMGTEVPQKVPQPVTHVSINSHNGFIHTSATTVTDALTTLPGYGVLDNRRAVQVYNNDSSTTLFIGGSDVTASTGIPVPAQSYSPIIDAGENMILYGLVSSGSINVRVLEISDEASGR